MKFWSLIFLLFSAQTFAALSYSEMRNAESKKIKAIFEGVAPESLHTNDEAYKKALSAHDDALTRLSPVLLNTFPKFSFSDDYEVKTSVFPNLFIRGDEDSYCYEGIHVDVTKKGKRPVTYYGYLTSETLLRDADEALAVEIPSWHREKANGVENATDATEVLTEVYCDGASHTQIKKLKNGQWLVSVTQDGVKEPTHLIGLRRVKDNFLFMKSALPASFAAKLTCPKKNRPEKAQIKCLSDEVTDKLIEPYSKPLQRVLESFQVI